MNFQVEYLNFSATNEGRQCVRAIADFISESAPRIDNASLRLLKTQSGGVVAGLSVDRGDANWELVSTSPTLSGVVARISEELQTKYKPIRLVG